MVKQSFCLLFSRHCEERNDEAIYFFLHMFEIAPLRSVFIKRAALIEAAPVFAALRSQ